jgi:pimeloyl-ACP methyl ester carboxylesterase
MSATEVPLDELSANATHRHVRSSEGSFHTSDDILITYKEYYVGAPATASDSKSRGYIALHGWLDNANSFDLIAPEIVESLECHMICLDLTGHGRSGTIKQFSQFYLWDFAGVILDLVEALNWDCFNIIAHSFGGHISYLYSGSFPSKVHNLIIIESIGHINRFQDDAESMNSYLLKRRQANLSESEAIKTGSTNSHRGKAVFDTIEAAARVRMQGVTTVSYNAALKLCERGLSKVDGGYTWTTDKRLFMRHFFRWDHEGFHSIMRNIRANVLLIVGNESSLLGTDVRAKNPLYNDRLECLQKRQSAKFSVVYLPGSHHLHLEEESAGEVAKNIVSFILAG